MRQFPVPDRSMRRFLAADCSMHQSPTPDRSMRQFLAADRYMRQFLGADCSMRQFLVADRSIRLNLLRVFYKKISNHFFSYIYNQRKRYVTRESGKMDAVSRKVLCLSTIQ